jgi:hypothetical protein
MGTVIHYAQGGKGERQQRWEHTQRAERLDMYRALQAQGVSRRQAAKCLTCLARRCKRGERGRRCSLPVPMWGYFA